MRPRLMVVLSIAGVVVAALWWYSGSSLTAKELAVMRAGFAGRWLLYTRDSLIETSRLHTLATCGRHDAPYSWRLVLTGEHYESLDYVAADPGKDWRSQLYIPNDTTENRAVFQVADTRKNSLSADLFVVLGEDSAYEQLFVDGETLGSVPGDCVLLMDARFPGSHWMQPIEVQVGDCDRSLPPSAIEHGRVLFFCDGESWLLNSSVPDEAICKFMTVSSASRFSRDEELSKYLILRLKTGGRKLVDEEHLEWPQR